MFAGVRTAADGEALRARLPGNIHPVLLDVTQQQSIATVLTDIGTEPLAGLVNNAGIAVTGPLELVPIEAWRRQFDVNVIGLVAVTQAFLPLLRAGQGRIVNIGSIAGRSALPGTGAYDSSKFAVEGITDALRMELHSAGISVSLIEAGGVATSIWNKTLDEIDALGRQASPETYGLYRGLMETVREETAAAVHRASPASEVVKAVEHAMTARRPKTRYVVGADVRLWQLLNLLPDRCRDWLILSRIKREL